MITCKECRYWAESSDDDDDRIMHPEDPDTYEPMALPFSVKKCTSENITLFERNPDSAGVSLCDGSDYRAQMYTGPDFGCVNGAPLEAQNVIT